MLFLGYHRSQAVNSILPVSAYHSRNATKWTFHPDGLIALLSSLILLLLYMENRLLGMVSETIGTKQQFRILCIRLQLTVVNNLAAIVPKHTMFVL